MKRLSIIISVFALLSCNRFLDELPDNRAEITTPALAAQLLVSAYPTDLPTMIFEYMSDNVDDNGPDYPMYYAAVTAYQAYHFEEFTEVSIDVPHTIWESVYRSVSAANKALEAIERMADPEATDGIKAEALLCRAFGHFILVNTFCIAYNPVSSDTDLGIPYVESSETTVDPTYERGTVAGVYEKIDRDIETALAIYDDAHISQPKYHFNPRAAYAFAARFNLYYGRWDKVIDYATQAIGDDPTDMLRDWDRFKPLQNLEDWNYAYISAGDAANLLLLPQYSLYGRVIVTPNRYGHNRAMAYGTIWQDFPWGNTVKNRDGGWGGTDQAIYVPMIREVFEVTNPTAQTGYVHTVVTYFTADETLACRAEAHVMRGEYDQAAADLNYWYVKNNFDGLSFTAQQISDYYGSPAFTRPVMESRFGVQPGMQENMLHAVLAMRRFNNVFEGLRFPDLKRHGIRVDHYAMITNTTGETLSLQPYEPRTAVQLPADVIYAGLPANPR